MDLFDITESNILFLKGVYISKCVDPTELGEIFDSSSSSSEEFDEIDDDMPEMDDDIMINDLQRTISNIERMQNLMGKTCRKEDIMSVYSTHMIIPEKIPRYFYDINDWPKFTRIKCWSCDRTFSSRPWFIPLNYTKILVDETGEEENREERIAMVVRGNFCSCNCAMWWIRYIRDPAIGGSRSDQDEKIRFLQELYQKFNNKPISHIEEAPWKIEMQQFGGDITSAEFSYKIDEKNKILGEDFANDFNHIN